MTAELQYQFKICVQYCVGVMAFLRQQPPSHCVIHFFQEDVFVIEHPGLQDGSKEPWPPALVADHVQELVKKHDVKTVGPCRL